MGELNQGSVDGQEKLPAAGKQASSCAGDRWVTCGRMQGRPWQGDCFWHNEIAEPVSLKDPANASDVDHPKEAWTACQTDSIDHHHHFLKK